MGDLLEIASFAFHAELKLFTMKVPGAKQKEYIPDIRDAIRIYEAKMREFSIKMKAACDESGVEFNFSQEEQKGFRRHDDEVMWEVISSHVSSDDLSTALLTQFHPIPVLRANINISSSRDLLQRITKEHGANGPRLLCCSSA